MGGKYPRLNTGMLADSFASNNERTYFPISSCPIIQTPSQYGQEIFGEAIMLNLKSKVAAITALIISTLFPNDRGVFDPKIVKRFHVKGIYLGTSKDELRDKLDKLYPSIFYDCKEKRNYNYGYVYCSNNEAGFRFDLNSQLTRFWFGKNQAEKIFGRKFPNQYSYVAFIKAKYHIEHLDIREASPRYDSTSHKMIAPKIYSSEISRTGHLEINENCVLIIGKWGPDRPIRFD